MADPCVIVSCISGCVDGGSWVIGLRPTSVSVFLLVTSYLNSLGRPLGRYSGKFPGRR